MKHLLNLFYGVFSALVLGFVIALFTGISPQTGFMISLGLSVAISFFQMPVGVLNAVVLKQLWEVELIKAFRHQHSWLAMVPDKSSYVNNDVINITALGVDPDVLINNTTYPIPLQVIDDDNVPVSLNKYQTKATPTTDDEVYAAPYDKPGSLMERHREALEEKTATHGLHLIAPSADSTATPIVQTTGGNNGNSRKRLTRNDVIAFKKRYDDLGVPMQGRVLVLCNDHVEDLLIEDLTFRDRFNNHESGAIAKNYYGFTVFEDNYNPIYDASHEKKAFGSALTGTDRNASVGFYTGRTFKARGSVKWYIDEPETGFQQWKANARLYFIAAPTKSEALGAITSANV